MCVMGHSCSTHRFRVLHQHTRGGSEGVSCFVDTKDKFNNSPEDEEHMDGPIADKDEANKIIG